MPKRLVQVSNVLAAFFVLHLFMKTSLLTCDMLYMSDAVTDVSSLFIFSKMCAVTYTSIGSPLRPMGQARVMPFSARLQ
jgi:hypothetical protein